MSLDLDHPAFAPGLERLRRITVAKAAARRQGGIVGKIKNVGLTLGAAATFARLFLLPVKQNAMRPDVRMVPAW